MLIYMHLVTQTLGLGLSSVHRLFLYSKHLCCSDTAALRAENEHLRQRVAELEQVAQTCRAQVHRLCR